MIAVCLYMERYRPSEPKANGAMSATGARKFRMAIHQLRSTQLVLNSAARNCESPKAFDAAFGKLMRQIDSTLERTK
jgi:hypothetical protein